jgi:hypothetical protein
MLISIMLFQDILLHLAQEENRDIIITSEETNIDSVFSNILILAPEDLNLSPHLTGWPKCRERVLSPLRIFSFSPFYPVIASPVAWRLYKRGSHYNTSGTGLRTRVRCREELYCLVSTVTWFASQRRKKRLRIWRTPKSTETFPRLSRQTIVFFLSFLSHFSVGN